MIYFKFHDAQLYFQHHYSSLQCHMIFRNYSNMLICCSRTISDYYQCWKQLCCFIFLWKLLHFIFQDNLMNWKFKRTVFIWNRTCFVTLQMSSLSLLVIWMHPCWTEVLRVAGVISVFLSLSQIWWSRFSGVCRRVGGCWWCWARTVCVRRASVCWSVVCVCTFITRRAFPLSPWDDARLAPLRWHRATAQQLHLHPLARRALRTNQLALLEASAARAASATARAREKTHR